MNKILTFKKNRFGLLYILIATFICISFVSRTVLLGHSFAMADFGPIALIKTYAVGLLYDFIASSYYVIPLALYLIIIPDRVFNSRYHRLFLLSGLFLSVYVLVCTAFSEWFFWDEFAKRFNFIAVDYLVYTQEVMHNILESYPIPLLLGSVFAVSCLIFYALHKTTNIFSSSFSGNSSLLKRLKTGGLFILLPILFFYSFNEQGIAEASSSNQYNAELSKDGMYSLFSAFRNNTLDYDEFYAKENIKTIMPNLKSLVQTGNSSFLGDKDQEEILRLVKNAGPEEKHNVMLIMVESLSAEYMGFYGDTRGLTPKLDKIAEQSLVFKNLYATGTRTIRGLEAVTLSVPPTPGTSVVKRPNNHNMFSSGFIFQEKGYENKFIYGGYGYFDNMNDFFSNNGFQIVDRSSMGSQEITFSNVWGVCDEDLFNKTLKESDKSYKDGKPFFNFLMTTSNHRPYTYPNGKIDIPSKTGRPGGVKYTDYAITKFLQDARSKPWFKNTIFIIIADHNGDSAGKDELPVWRYKIPCIVYAPEIVKPGIVNKLSSQIDLMPTIFGMLHWSYQSKFYGQNILDNDFRERALVGTYQKLGMFRNGCLTMLQPDKSVKEFRIDGETLYDAKYSAIPTKPQDRLDAITYYQSASHFYKFGLDRWTKQR